MLDIRDRMQSAAGQAHPPQDTKALIILPTITPEVVEASFGEVYYSTRMVDTFNISMSTDENNSEVSWLATLGSLTTTLPLLRIAESPPLTTTAKTPRVDIVLCCR